MKFSHSALSAVALAGIATTAHASTVTEKLTAVISGSNTIDTLGYFGKAGANLSGQKASIQVQYVSKYLPTHKPCRISPTTCTTYENQQGPNLSASVLISVTIAGHTVTYSPVNLGDLILQNTKGANQFAIYSDAFSGMGDGLKGVGVSVKFTSPLKFGAKLSPSNQPVLNISTAYDYVIFFTPSSSTPAEQLDFVVRSGAP